MVLRINLTLEEAGCGLSLGAVRARYFRKKKPVGPWKVLQKELFEMKFDLKVVPKFF